MLMPPKMVAAGLEHSSQTISGNEEAVRRRRQLGGPAAMAGFARPDRVIE
jgi:hypothetical protein